MSFPKERLSNLCLKITDGSHNPPKGIDFSEYLMFSSKNIDNDKITYESPRYLTKEDFELENRRTQVAPSDVLLTIVGTIGRCAVVPAEIPNICLQRSVAVIKPNQNKILSRFLMYSLMSMLEYLNSRARGVAQKGIYLETIRDLEITIPPISTQQKIVAKLDAIFAEIDKATAAAEANAKNAEALFQSYLSEVFERSDKSWKQTNLKDIAEYFNGLTYSPKDVNENGTIVLRSSNVQDDKILLDDLVRVNSSIKEKLYVKSGDILMCSRNGSKRLVGKTAIIPNLNEKMTFGTFMMIVRSDSNIFLEWFFKSDFFKRQISAGENTMINQITRYMLDEIVVPMPDFPTQKLVANKISDLYDASHSLKNFYRRKINDMTTLKNSILKKAFSGELVKE